MLTPLVLTQLLCAAVLALSGIAKLREPQASRDAFIALRLPQWLAAGPAPRLLPYAELVLAVGLLAGRGWMLVLFTGATALLFVAYLVVIGRALRFDEPVHCNCFGKIGDHSVSVRTLIRNWLLVVAAAGALFGALGGVAVVPVLTGPGAGSVWGWLIAALLCVAVGVLILGRGVPEAAPSAPAAATGAARPLPELLVTDVDTGAQLDLRSLGSDGPVALVTVTFGCGPCLRVAGQIPVWRAAGLPVRTLVRHTHTRLFPDQDGLGALEDHTGQVIPELFGIQAPAAYVVRDGRIEAGPAIGEEAVADLVRTLATDPDQVVDLGYDPFRLPEDEPASAPQETDEQEYVRSLIPDVVLLDREQQPTTLRTLALERAQLVITINCYCGPAMTALHRVARYREQLPQLGVRVLTSVDLTLIDDLDPEVLATSVYDHQQITHRALGITGSPAAVLLGADGLLAGGPVTGPDEVDAFVAEIVAQFAEAEVEG